MSAQETVEKLPPQSIDAEIAVLGSMLLDRDAISHAIEGLNASYFYKEAHKKIYSAVLKLFGSVSNDMISDALAVEGIKIDKHDITIEEPIKKLGVYQAPVKLHPEVKATLKVWIVKK